MCCRACLPLPYLTHPHRARAPPPFPLDVLQGLPALALPYSSSPSMRPSSLSLGCAAGSACPCPTLLILTEHAPLPPFPWMCCRACLSLPYLTHPHQARAPPCMTRSCLTPPVPAPTLQHAVHPQFRPTALSSEVHALMKPYEKEPSHQRSMHIKPWRIRTPACAMRTAALGRNTTGPCAAVLQPARLRAAPLCNTVCACAPACRPVNLPDPRTLFSDDEGSGSDADSSARVCVRAGLAAPAPPATAAPAMVALGVGAGSGTAEAVTTAPLSPSRLSLPDPPPSISPGPSPRPPALHSPPAHAHPPHAQAFPPPFKFRVFGAQTAADACAPVVGAAHPASKHVLLVGWIRLGEGTWCTV